MIWPIFNCGTPFGYLSYISLFNSQIGKDQVENPMRCSVFYDRCLNTRLVAQLEEGTRHRERVTKGILVGHPVVLKSCENFQNFFFAPINLK